MMTEYKIVEGNLEVTETSKDIKTKEDLDYELEQAEAEVTRIKEMLSHFK